MQVAEANEIRLSACLIVRDSSATLSECLASIRPWVDELVVVDTGSVDDTVSIARDFGARVFHFPWCDDFSAARNESLRNARGKWLFWMDSDDIITPDNGRRLRQLATESAANPMAYVMQVHCPVIKPDGQSGVTVVDHVKMFRNLPELRFEGRIHEQILPALRRLGGELAWTDFFVMHANSDQSAEGRQRKIERDLRLLELDLRDRPNHPFVLFNLGMTYSEAEDHTAAVQVLQRCLEVSSTTESHVRKAFALLVGSLTKLNDYNTANLIVQRGLAIFPDDPELLFRNGVIAHIDGRYDDAVVSYHSAMLGPSDHYFSSVDPSICGYKARHNLALVYADMGRHELAELQWRSVLAELPDYRPAWLGLGDSLMRQQKFFTLDFELGRLPQSAELADVADSLRAQLPTRRASETKTVSNPTSLPQPDPQIIISLCMIARDSARTIGNALESVAPWVNEIIVVDTGSTDDTVQIASRLGARVFHFPWCDDFSAARNESLRHARGKWILWMDSDDTIDPINGRKLRELVQRAHPPDVMGFVMQVHCPGPGDGDQEQEDVTVVDHVKIFRKRQDLQFDGRIHEQILPAINRSRGTVLWTDIFVVHSGHDHSAAGQAKKRARDLHLLHLELKERPDHPFTLFNLGMTYTDMDCYEQAVEYLLGSIRHSKPSESHLRKAYALLVFDFKMLNRLADAWRYCEEGLRLFPDDFELRFRSGVLLHEMGRYAEAASAYRSVLNSSGDFHFSSYDIGIRGFKARHNLATTLTAMGDVGSAEIQWREIAHEKPSYLPAWQSLGECLVKQRKYQSALVLAERIDEQHAFPTAGALLRSSVHEAQGEFRKALKELERAVRVHPGDRATLSQLCRISFEHGDLPTAEVYLNQLLDVDPQDASAYHNLGSLRLQQGRAADAVELFAQAITRRPNFADSFVYLGYALEQLGSTENAIDAWNHAILIDPGCTAAAEGIARQLHTPRAAVTSQ